MDKQETAAGADADGRTDAAAAAGTGGAVGAADSVSRRAFMRHAGVAVAAAGTALAFEARAAAPPDQSEQVAASAWLFLQPDEVRFLEAAVERLIPADANGPGARAAGVVRYLDRQLAGAWGAGERLYRAGPWMQGSATQGYQLPFTPAELFRTALRGIAADLARAGGADFAQRAPAAQDAYLKQLEDGRIDLGAVPSAVFFKSLHAATLEGWFSDPVYGGNRDMVAWRMLGFPGAYASFYELVDQHGLAYTRRPVSLGEDARGRVHMMSVDGMGGHGTGR